MLPADNLLLRELPEDELSHLLGHCEQVPLVFGEVLCEAGASFVHLYFPSTGFISVATALRDHPPLALGLIGKEGMLGATLALGMSDAPVRAVVQGNGKALRISRADLCDCLPHCPALLQAMKRYLYVLLAQLAQNVACGHFHEVEPRLARWLLMTHDRVQGDHFYLTHEFLADMLGTRRSGVSIAAGALQLRKLIHYSRGQITVLDRSGLERAACECYSAMSDDYIRLFPPP